MIHGVFESIISKKYYVLRVRVRQDNFHYCRPYDLVTLLHDFSRIVVIKNLTVFCLAFEWADLPPDIQTAAESLGYSEQLWDNSGYLPLFQTKWNDLTGTQ